MKIEDMPVKQVTPEESWEYFKENFFVPICSPKYRGVIFLKDEVGYFNNQRIVVDR